VLDGGGRIFWQAGRERPYLGNNRGPLSSGAASEL
jgi:hypothetical protein